MCADVVPPTLFLPSLKRLRTCPEKNVLDALAALRYIYLPEVRGSSRRRYASESRPPHSTSNVFRDTQTTPSRNGDADLVTIRADAFERSFAIQWLTRFVAFFSDVSDEGLGTRAVGSQALEEAASLLAICAGAAASGAVTRTFTFPYLSRSTYNGPTGNDPPDDVSVILRDAPLESSDFTSVGAQTWGGSCILAEMIAESPHQFGIFPRNEAETLTHPWRQTAPFRALELGAGTGLASLVLGKVLARMRGGPSCSEGLRTAVSGDDLVIATDFHPSVLTNLHANVTVNFPSVASHADGDRRVSTPSGSGPKMVILPLDWSVVHACQGDPCRVHDTAETATVSTLDVALPKACDSYTVMSLNPQAQERNAQSLATNVPELREPFDLIIGADIIYEHSHARWVRTCVERFLRKPTFPSHPQDGSMFSSMYQTHRVLAAGGQQRNEHDTMDVRTNASAVFHLVIPLRRTHAVESQSVEQTFGRAGETRSAGAEADATVERGSLGLAILSQEDIVCDAYSDREEEVVYRYYRIGWV